MESLKHRYNTVAAAAVQECSVCILVVIVCRGLHVVLFWDALLRRRSPTDNDPLPDADGKLIHEKPKGKNGPSIRELMS